MPDDAGVVTPPAEDEVPVYQHVDLRQDVDQVQVARGLVPSERELESGEVPAYEFQPYQAEEVKFSTADAIRRAKDQLNLRELVGAAGLLPLVILGGSTFLTQLTNQSLNFLFPEIRNDFGFNIAFFALFANVVYYVLFVVAPLAGYVADRVKRLPLLIGAHVLGGAGHVTLAMSTGIPMLLGGQALTGVAGAAAAPVGFPLLTDFYPPRSRARVFAFVAVMSTLGSIFGPIVGGLLGGTVGWRWTYAVMGVASIGLALAYFLLKEPVRGKLDREAAGLPPEAALEEQRPLGWAEAWRAAASIKTLRRIWFALPFFVLGGYEFVIFANLYVANHFYVGTLARGFIVSLATIPGLAGIVLGGAVTDRILAYKPGRIFGLLALVNMLTAVSVVLFAFAPNIVVAVLLLVPSLFFGALINPAFQTVSSLVLPARIRGLGLQTLSPWLLLGFVLAQLLATLIGTQDLHVFFIWFAVFIAIGSVVIGSAGSGVESDIRAALAASAAEIEARKAKDSGRSKMLICRDVDVTYDGAQVLFGVDLDVEEGELVALLGTNGAGKSTLLRAIAGIQEASNGAVFLDGDDITHMPPHQIAERGVVMMPGGQATFPTLTVEQNLKTAAWLYRSDGAYVKRRMEEVLALFPRLQERWNALAGNLSGGEQQMVALGQALLMKPRLLMIDELSLGLSPQVVEELLEALRQINRQGTTVIVVEQSINVALQIAERAVYMEKGQVQFDGSVKELFNRPDVMHSVFLAGATTSGGLSQATERRLLELSQSGDVQTTLQVDDLWLQYGGVKVLNGMSLNVARGEVVGLIGPNGAGKTSLFDAITGFAKPDAGAVRFLDIDVTRMRPDARARLGLARSYQNVRLFPALTVRENIAVALERHLQSRNAVLAAIWSPMTRRSERRVRRRVDNLIESLNLGAYTNKFLSELSTGTRRIVDIACLLAAGPTLLLLDEPSSGLAQAETEQLGPVIGRIVKETGCAVLIIEHDLGLVASVSHRLVAMRLGQVMAEGKPADVLGNQEVIDAILGGASQAVVSRSVQLEGAKS